MPSSACLRDLMPLGKAAVNEVEDARRKIFLHGLEQKYKKIADRWARWPMACDMLRIRKRLSAYLGSSGTLFITSQVAMQRKAVALPIGMAPVARKVPRAHDHCYTISSQQSVLAPRVAHVANSFGTTIEASLGMPGADQGDPRVEEGRWHARRGSAMYPFRTCAVHSFRRVRVRPI
jgi:hypothetical protein